MYGSRLGGGVFRWDGMETEGVVLLSFGDRLPTGTVGLDGNDGGGF